MSLECPPFCSNDCKGILMDGKLRSILSLLHSPPTLCFSHLPISPLPFTLPQPPSSFCDSLHSLGCPWTPSISTSWRLAASGLCTTEGHSANWAKSPDLCVPSLPFPSILPLLPLSFSLPSFPPSSFFPQSFLFPCSKPPESYAGPTQVSFRFPWLPLCLFVCFPKSSPGNRDFKMKKQMGTFLGVLKDTSSCRDKGSGLGLPS